MIEMVSTLLYALACAFVAIAAYGMGRAFENIEEADILTMKFFAYIGCAFFVAATLLRLAP